MRPTKAVIKLSALKHNLRIIRQLAPTSKVMAVVKADAYGHGILRAAQALEDAEALAVACIDEAIELRKGGITQPIVLLEGCYDSQELRLADQFNLETVVHQAEQIKQILAACLAKPISVWLKLDCEMNRLGLSSAEFESAVRSLESAPQVSELRFMTHFSSADELHNNKTVEQLKQFRGACQGKAYERSAANSAAILAWPESHFDWVRPGILLYGCSPLPSKTGPQHSLIPVMSLYSSIISIKSLEPGQTVGYGEQWKATKSTKIAIVAIGYGDGYSRHAKNGTPVWVNGRTVPLVGRVSMDMIAIEVGADATDLIGDKVELWGDNLPIETVAHCADTICYTLLCGVTSRVKFEWVD